MRYLPSTIVFLIFSSSQYLFAECNIKVAIAAGQYLAVLEVAKLTKYQNNSVCEVLNYEFWNCTERQKSQLKSAFNLKEVLGNYCQPHLPPPKNSIDNDAFMKGTDLYSWRDYNGYIWYALLPGTNRTKTTKEIIENKISPGLLKREIQNLPLKIHISWNTLATIEDKANIELILPDKKTQKEIQNAAGQRKIEVRIDR